MIEEINVEMALEYIRDNAPDYGDAKAARVFIEQFRKSKKAMLMLEVEGTGLVRESYAYSHPEYIKLLEDYKTAIEEEEKLKWLMVAARAKIEVWRTQQANNRRVDGAHT